MLQQVVEKFMNNPELLEKFQQGQISVVGISETEAAALNDAFSESTQEDRSRGMCYWK
ncbi:competence pheromone ComX [Pontibacillus salicampi]|uniref:ComX pheromone n=1 Tax=Pontibacillus salicampi TaxID=1449801 RepID=A0ABV6LRU3_9BACI